MSSRPPPSRCIFLAHRSTFRWRVGIACFYQCGLESVPVSITHKLEDSFMGGTRTTWQPQPICNPADIHKPIDMCNPHDISAPTDTHRPIDTRLYLAIINASQASMFTSQESGRDIGGRKCSEKYPSQSVYFSC